MLDQETLKRVLHGDLEKEIHIEDKLFTPIEKVEMTTTKTMTEAAQTTEAYVRGGGPADENLLSPQRDLKYNVGGAVSTLTQTGTACALVLLVNVTRPSLLHGKIGRAHV